MDTDSYSFVLALLTGDLESALEIQHRYQDDGLRDFFGLVSGTIAAIFGNLGTDLRKKLELSLRFAVTRDVSYLDAARDVGYVESGQYL